VKTSNEEVKTYTFLISCVGGLHRANIPDFKDRSKFQGQSWHTTEWPKNADFSGKRVGLIGNGASAVQILPEIVKRMETKQVVMFQRTAHYCFPRLAPFYLEK